MYFSKINRIWFDNFLILFYYYRIRQIPDGYASQTALANSPELLLGLQTMTADMAQAAGFVNSVVFKEVCNG